MPAWMPAALIHRDASTPLAAPDIHAGIQQTGPADGWFGDYLRDPGGALLALLGHLRDWAVSWGPVVTPVLALGVAGFVVGRRRWRRRCHAPSNTSG